MSLRTLLLPSPPVPPALGWFYTDNIQHHRIGSAAQPYPSTASRGRHPRKVGSDSEPLGTRLQVSRFTERDFSRNSETQWSGRIFSAGECSLATFALKQGKGGCLHSRAFVHCNLYWFTKHNCSTKSCTNFVGEGFYPSRKITGKIFLMHKITVTTNLQTT